MIDFRYHLVSVIAIFMALAVGIVLGAGPLKEDIGTTLTSEITKLREDKAALNGELTTARRSVAAGESYAAASRPVVLAGRLADRRVVVVAAAGADEQVVSGVQTALTESGATVASVVRLSDEWTRPASAGELTASVRQAAEALQIDTRAVGDGLLPGTVLGRAALTGPVQDRGQVEESRARQAFEVLRGKGLLSVRGEDPTGATLLVTVAAPMVANPAAGTGPQVQAYARLVRGADAVSNGSVLVSPTRPTDDADNLSAAAVVSGVRADRAAAAAVSTVDDADRAMGQVATAVALAAQQQGGAGRYGIGSDAESVIPDLGR